MMEVLSILHEPSCKEAALIFSVLTYGLVTDGSNLLSHNSSKGRHAVPQLPQLCRGFARPR